MLLNYISVVEMLSTLKVGGSQVVALEAVDCLERIQSFATEFDSMCLHSQKVENRINEIIVQELVSAISKYGTSTDKRIVGSYFSNELMASGDC